MPAVVWGDRGKVDTPLTEGVKTQKTVMEAERMLSRPIHLGWTQGSKSNRTWGNRGKGGRDDEEGGGDMREYKTGGFGHRGQRWREKHWDTGSVS